MKKAYTTPEIRVIAINRDSDLVCQSYMDRNGTPITDPDDIG